MTSPRLQQLGIDRLSKQERLSLISEIWDSIDSVDDLEVSQEHREELDRRLASADANASASLPWEEVRERLLGGK